MTRLGVGALLTVAAAICATGPASADVFNSFTTISGTDFVTAGTGGLRGTGTGTLTVGGVTGPVSESYLYWHGPTDSSAPDANATVTVNGSGVTGTNVGFAHDNEWGFDNSQAYRGDTTSIINGNGVYNLTNFNAPPTVEVNGAAAAVFFDDGDTSNDRDVTIFNGNDSNFRLNPADPTGWDVSLNGIIYSSGSAFLTLFVSDGQNFQNQNTLEDGTLSINGTPIASGIIFQGDGLPGPGIPVGVGDGNGNLFDIKKFDITSFLSVGINNLHLTLQVDAGKFNDALSLVAAFIDLPARVRDVPEPATIALFAMGLVGLGFARRRWTRPLEQDAR